MKLSIDLADREEIAAAVPLLQLILDNTPAKACGGQCQALAMPLYDEYKQAAAAEILATLPHGGIAYNDPPGSDPAAVFGGAAVPAPLAASTPQPAAAATVAPAVPAITAPITTTHGPASSGAVAASVELDSKGLPWDERIHAGTKTKIKSGEWKAKKGVEAATVAQVETELRARVAGNVASPVVPTVPTPPLASPVGASSPITTASPAVAPATDPAAVFGGAPAAPANPDPATFEQLMPRITAAVTAGIMPPTAVGAACAAHGIASVVTLQQSPQFVPPVWATLKQQYPALV